MCGGRSRRFGTDKFSHKIGNNTILDSVIEKFEARTDDIFLQVSENQCIDQPRINNYKSIKKNVDIIKDHGPLGGIYSAIEFAKYNSVFVVAGDLPFVDEQIYFELLKNSSAQLVVPQWKSGFVEPLCALYSKELLRAIKDQLDDGNLKISNLYKSIEENYSGKCSVVYLKIDELIERNIISSDCFKNINTYQDLF